MLIYALILAGCAGQGTSPSPGSQVVASDPAKPEICRLTGQLLSVPGHVDAQGAPVYTVESLKAIANSGLPLDVIAGRLRAELGDTARTLEEIKVFNARWMANCGAGK